MIVTFYSFKGGAGRTLALANVGVLLAQNGHRVLVVDFDLEAPGLTRYLEKEFGGDLQYKRGLLELLERQRDAGDATNHLREYTVEIMHNTKGGVLELLTSGYQDKSYPKRVLDFDWSEFFMNDDGGNFFERCRQEWTKRYDYVLIDSRTGITDSGGICTIQLPDVIVPVFTASRQSVDGVIDVMRRAQEGRQLLAYDRAPAAIVPLPSRFDSRTEYELSQQWLDEFAIQFKEFYTSWLPKEIPVRQVLERTKLPYVAFFSFGERLPAFEESGSDPESLGYALRTFARLLESSLQDTSSLIASSGGAVDHGETVPLTEAKDQAIGDIGARIRLTHRPWPTIVGLVVLLIMFSLVGSWATFSLRAPNSTQHGPTPSQSTVLVGHTDSVTTVAFSPDGHTLASGSADQTIRLWNVTDPTHLTPLSTLTGHTGTVFSVAFSPDGRTLASGSADHTVRLWNVTDLTHPALGQPLTGHTDSVFSVAFSPDGRTLASGSADHTARLWDVTDPTHPAALSTLTGHTNIVKSVAFSPDGHTLATASADRTARLWDVHDPHNPAALSVLTGHTNTVSSVAFSPDGHTLATASADRTARLWDVHDPRHPTPLGQPLTGYTNFVTSVAFSPDGHTLASGSADQTIRLWSLP